MRMIMPAIIDQAGRHTQADQERGGEERIRERDGVDERAVGESGPGARRLGQTGDATSSPVT
jgi:hypothetical protein